MITEEKRYRRLFETSRDGILIADLKTSQVIDVNPRFGEMFGCSPKELIDREIWDCQPFLQNGFGKILVEELRNQETVRYEKTLHSKNGENIDIELLCNVYIEDNDGSRKVIQCNIRDISERKRALSALRESEEKFRLLVDGVKDYAIFMLDADARVASWNLGAERILGYTQSEILGRNFSVFFTPEDLKALQHEQEVQKAIAEGASEDERWHLRKDGTRFFASGVLTALRGDNYKLLGFAKVMRDMTERRNTEEALRQAHKLESIGILAGGVAHDFNNLLTGILGNASLALDHFNSLHPARPMIEDVVASSKRAADLTRQLLAYAGKGQFVIEQVYLSELVSEILHLIQASIPKKVRLQLDLADNIPAIEADASQMQQIVMNLIINAAESIGGKDGIVWVSSGVQEVQEHQLRDVSGLGEIGPGTYVFLEVRDTGSGMDEVTRSKIFDPFFTTKFAGRGLGLAAVSGIIRGHKGTIRVSSEPGQGSTFRVLLPAYQGSSPIIRIRELRKGFTRERYGSGGRR